jgi:hypothetical protein
VSSVVSLLTLRTAGTTGDTEEHGGKPPVVAEFET